METENSYSVVVECENCYFEEKLTLAKGTKVWETICPNCGCANLRRNQYFYEHNGPHFKRCGDPLCWCVR